MLTLTNDQVGAPSTANTLYPAFLAQRADVMAAVESLRHAAIIAGILKVTPQ